MNRDDVCRLETNYAGELVDLAARLQLVEAVYDQEQEGDGLHEYVYGNISGERVEIIRRLGEESAAIFKLGSPPFFAPTCLKHILQSLDEIEVRVVAYWTQGSLSTGEPIPYEPGSA